MAQVILYQCVGSDARIENTTKSRDGFAGLCYHGISRGIAS